MKTLACVLAAVVVLLAAATGANAGDQIDAATTFLLGWGKGNWDDVRATARDTVAVSAGGKEASLDVAGGKAGAALVLPFRGLSTVRDAARRVTGVAVEEIAVRVDGTEARGRGRLAMEEKDGVFRVTTVTVE